MRQRLTARTDQIWKLAAAWHRRSKSHGKPGRDRVMFSAGVHLKEFPGTSSRSPLPAGPTPSKGPVVRIWVRFGLAASHAKLPARPLRREPSRLGDRGEVNQSCTI